jgi:glycerol-3-phosphate dehydrogenase
MSEIAIVGAGMMGSALCWPLTDNGHSVTLVGTHLDRDIISRCRKERYHPTLNRTLPGNVKPYYLKQIDQALESHDLPLLRWLCRIVTEDRPAEIPLEELRMAERQSGSFFTGS